MQKKVCELVVGDLVDLEGDQYADPKKENPTYPFEYVEVIGTKRETVDCIRVDFEGGESVGFPVDHLVTVAS